MVAATSMAAHATDYTDQLLVLVNGKGAMQQATISVNEHDGLYDLNLKNFVLMNGDQPMPVGNVELKDIVPEPAGDAIFLRTNQYIIVTEGDLPDVLFWLGPALGQLPVQVTAVLTPNRPNAQTTNNLNDQTTNLRALIDLDLTDMLGQVINVSFGEELISGTNYHIPNGGFEDWHTSTKGYEEPNAWHSFESASGTLASLAGHHIEKTNRLNDQATNFCARIYATSIFGIVANGTMTTGRMNAGSIIATDTSNHAFIDMSQTDLDGNGDPFYVTLNSRPDSLVLWVQFNRNTDTEDIAYATVSAVITDGTRYQEPEDKEYNNIVARAVNNQIAPTNSQWRRISVPFVYTDNKVEPRAIMVTVSTNANPGQGSDGDEVLIDDLTLVYNSQLDVLSVDGFQPDVYDYSVDKHLSIDDANFVCRPNGKAAYVLMTDNKEEGKIIIDVFAADLRSRSTYTVSYNKEQQMKGDVNGDHVVDVADISAVITSMVSGKYAPEADVNNDGAIDVADISSIISIMAAGGSEHVSAPSASLPIPGY